MNFRYKIMRFMSGRYGIDPLFWAMFAFSMVLAFLNIFFHSAIVQIIVYLVEILAILRVFSKNISARQKENALLFGWVQKVKNKNAEAKARRADTSHVYKKCPFCKATLRLPKKPGKHSVVCPKCSKSFKVRI